MAHSDKNIVITPNIGSTTADPQIVFSGADATLGPQNITMKAYSTNSGTLSFEGSAGQLFSITNSLSGTIFSVNDVSGIPSIEVLDTGLIKLAQYSGNVLLGSGTDDGTNKLQVTGNASVTGTVTAPTFSGALSGNASTATTLQTARLIGGVSFNGSANINLPGVNTAGNQNTTGSAATLTTGRTIALTGDVAYTSGAFNGSANVTGTATLANSGVTAGTYTKVTVDAKGRVTVGASIAAGDVPTLNQNTTGNAATATTLQTARTINGTSFNGSANITITANTPNTLTRGTYLTGNNFNGSAATTWAVDATDANTASKVVARNASGNFSAGTITAALSGNATTATTLQNSRTIALTGDVTYTSGAFNGSANVTGTATLASVGTAGTYTKVTTDAKGRVTSGTTLVAADIPNLDAAKITSGIIDAARLPSYVDDVLEFANLAGFPTTGETGKLYVALDTNKVYRWSGTVYIFITSGAVDSVAGKTGVVTLVKADVGLGNVDNTSDAAKPVSTAQQTALNLKANIASPVFTGNVTGLGVSTGTSFNAITGLATVAPLVAGTAAVGTSTLTARQDHVHPLQTTVSGNAGSATVLQTARTINGTSFNGSANITTANWGTARSISIGGTSKSVNGSADVTWAASEISAQTAINYNGVAQSTYTPSLRSNDNISGGGTITVDASGSVLWNSRFIVISNGNGTNFSTTGYFDIACPTSGTITGVGGATSVTATAAGIPLAAWHAIYYILPIGSTNTSVAANFRVASYTSALDIPHNWVLICVRNGDNGQVYFSAGYTLAVNQSIITGTYNARRANFADTLTTARTIGGVSFNGSANINLPGVNAAGNQNTTGSAATLTTGRTIALTGDVTYTSGSFNGSANVTGTATLANSGVTAGTYTAATVVVDAKGRVTSASSNTIPSVGNGTLTLATSGIATGSQTFTANQSTAATFTVNVPATNIAEGTRTTTAVPITSSTGTGATLSAASTTLAGVMTSADKTKLDGIAAGAQVNVATNLGITAGTTAGPIVTSSTGTSATLPTASDTASGVVTTGAQTWAGVKTFNSTITGSVSGNAGTATTLQTARTIGGVSFNGSANINLPGVNTAGNQNTTGSAASVSGTTTAAVPTEALASGTANSTTYLRGDRTWATISGGATLSNNTTTNSDAFYPAMSQTNTSGAWSTAVVSSTKMYFNPSTGTLSATNFNSLSDANAKKDISTIKGALDKALALRGVDYVLIDSEQKQIGVIAQEVEKIIPEVVSTSSDGRKSVSYGNIVGLLIEAIKEQQKQIDELKNMLQK